jgi:hypothetical protein
MGSEGAKKRKAVPQDADGADSYLQHHPRVSLCTSLFPNSVSLNPPRSGSWGESCCFTNKEAEAQAIK